MAKAKTRVECVVVCLAYAALYHFAAMGVLFVGGPSDAEFQARPPVVQAAVILGALGLIVVRTVFVMCAVGYLLFFDLIEAERQGREEAEADARVGRD